MGSDVNGEILGDEYKGYTFRITGGNDKQGFTMKQGILINGRVRILMKESKLFFHFCPLKIWYLRRNRWLALIMFRIDWLIMQVKNFI
jgi:hypothetical protein